MPDVTAHPDSALIAAVLRQDRVAARRLVTRLTPVIQRRVARCLVASKAGIGRDRRQEVADLTQDVFRLLFDKDGRILQRWDPDAGLSLDNFVGLVARRHALSILRSGTRTPWRDDPVEDIERLMLSKDDPEDTVVSQDLLKRVVDELEAELSPKGWLLFQRLLIDEADVPTLVTELGMKRDAIYAWRSRLNKLVRQKAKILMSDPDAQSRIPPQPKAGS